MRILRFLSMALLVAIAACNQTPPDFELLVSSGMSFSQGYSGQVRVTVQPIAGFSQSVNLSVEASSLPAGLTAAFEPPTITTGGSTLTVSANTSIAPGVYTLKVQGVAGSLSKTANLRVEIKPISEFTFDPLDGPISLGTGVSKNISLTWQRVGGFTGAVQLSLEKADGTALPIGITASFAPNNTTGNSSTLTLSVGAAVPNGSYALQVKGVSGIITKTLPLTLEVITPDFGLSVDPASQTFTTIDPKTLTLNINRIGGFPAAVALSLEKSDGSPLPTGLSAVFDPTSASGNTSQLKITPSGTLPAGTYNLRVKGVASGLTRTTPLTLEVNLAPDFALSANPAILAIRQTKQGGTTLNINRIGGHSQALNVTLESQDGSPLPVGVSLVPPITAVSSNATSAPINIQVENTATVGTYALRLKASDGAITHTTNLTLEVRPEVDPDFALSVQSVGNTLGNTFTTTITVVRYGGFSEPITLELIAPESFQQPSFNPPVLTSSTPSSTLTFKPSVAGGYRVKVRGTTSTLVREASFSVGVDDFNLGLSQTTIDIKRGESATITVTRSIFDGGSITLNLDNGTDQIPSGVNATFGVNPIPSGPCCAVATTSMTINVPAGTPVGVYKLRLKGTSNLGVPGIDSQDRFSPFSLNVQP